LEIEALRLMINGEGLTEDYFLGLDDDYFRFEDTKKLFKTLKSYVLHCRESSKKINFPIEIPSEQLEDKEVKKLYNFIYFDTKPYKNGKVDFREVLRNFKLLSLFQQIDRIRREMLQIEEEGKKGKAGNEIKQKYNHLYQQLIKLEKEKMELKVP